MVNTFNGNYIFYIQETLINKIFDFLPLKVIHDVKCSCWKLQLIRKIERNETLVFTKVCDAEYFLSDNLQNFIHSKLKNLTNFLSQNFL